MVWAGKGAGVPPILITMPDEPIAIAVTDVLDLHSIPPCDVRGVVEEYLVEARRLGLRHLRIIHGRGIGVQRETVRSILASTAGVTGYGNAAEEAGGWGATTVTLAEVP